MWKLLLDFERERESERERERETPPGSSTVHTYCIYRIHVIYV